MLLCFGRGLRSAAHGRLETVKDGSQACTQEGGKEREGGRACLGRARVEEEEKEGGNGKNVKCILRNLTSFNTST